MAHFGWPWSDVPTAVALRNPDVYLDVSGCRPRHLPLTALVHLNVPLRDRPLFETDYPMLMQEERVADFAEVGSGLKSGVAEELMKEKARRLLGD